jgi:TfoX/Sxy family transcriptional regulator of competence genes
MAYNELLAQRTHEVLKDIPGLVEKKMFGGIGYLLDGNMACGVNGDHLIVRLSNADSLDALALPHVHVFDITGRPMNGWITVEASGTANDDDLRIWIERGLHYAQGLPPK